MREPPRIVPRAAGRRAPAQPAPILASLRRHGRRASGLVLLPYLACLFLISFGHHHVAWREGPPGPGVHLAGASAHSDATDECRACELQRASRCTPPPALNLLPPGRRETRRCAVPTTGERRL